MCLCVSNTAVMQDKLPKQGASVNEEKTQVLYGESNASLCDLTIYLHCYGNPID